LVKGRLIDRHIDEDGLGAVFLAGRESGGSCEDCQDQQDFFHDRLLR
jgi:hypothetical protein